MAFNINEFSSKVKEKGVMRTNKFRVSFHKPAGFIGNPHYETIKGHMDELHFWCESSSIPRLIIGSQTVYRYGVGLLEKKPVFPQFTDVSMVFYTDRAGFNWKLFHQWTQMIVNYNMSKGIGNDEAGVVFDKKVWPFEVAYKEDYTTDLIIETFDDFGNKAITVYLREAYPIMVGEMRLAWNAKNEIAMVPVTFTFMDWYTSQEVETDPSKK